MLLYTFQFLMLVHFNFFVKLQCTFITSKFRTRDDLIQFIYIYRAGCCPRFNLPHFRYNVRLISVLLFCIDNSVVFQWVTLNIIGGIHKNFMFGWYHRVFRFEADNLQSGGDDDHTLVDVPNLGAISPDMCGMLRADGGGDHLLLGLDIDVGGDVDTQCQQHLDHTVHLPLTRGHLEGVQTSQEGGDIRDGDAGQDQRVRVRVRQGQQAVLDQVAAAAQDNPANGKVWTLGFTVDNVTDRIERFRRHKIFADLRRVYLDGDPQYCGEVTACAPAESCHTCPPSQPGPTCSNQWII